MPIVSEKGRDKGVMLRFLFGEGSVVVFIASVGEFYEMQSACGFKCGECFGVVCSEEWCKGAV